MDIFWIVASCLFILAGLVGCFLPVLPGPPLTYIGLLLVQLRTISPFTSRFLWIWAGVVVVVSILDYVIPVYGTKKMGGTKYGVWGCSIGLVAGLWFGPLGIIFGPFFGALIGELIASTRAENALKAAFGSFIGFLFGTLLKVVTCLVMAWYFISALL